MSGKVVRAALVGTALAWAALGPGPGSPSVGVAAAADEPDAEDVRRAKKEFDEGARAYKDEQWELAASHFEAADEAAPSARAMRMAIRSRQKAGQKARAATLAAAALGRYDDAKTVEIAQGQVDDTGDLHRVDVACKAPCVLAIGTRAVPGAAKEAWTVFVDPGAVKVSASFGDAGESVTEALEATAGGKTSLELEPGEVAAPPKPAPAPAPMAMDETSEPEPSATDEADEESGGIPQPVFWVGLVATAGAGAVTIWSGVDTTQDPGEDAVREECRGQGTDCATYQRGLEKQLRTNVLIGVTAGLGVITGIVGIFTDWDGAAEGEETGWRLGPGPGDAGLSLGGVF